MRLDYCSNEVARALSPKMEPPLFNVSTTARAMSATRHQSAALTLVQGSASETTQSAKAVCNLWTCGKRSAGSLARQRRTTASTSGEREQLVFRRGLKRFCCGKMIHRRGVRSVRRVHVLFHAFPCITFSKQVNARVAFNQCIGSRILVKKAQREFAAGQYVPKRANEGL